MNTNFRLTASLKKDIRDTQQAYLEQIVDILCDAAKEINEPIGFDEIYHHSCFFKQQYKELCKQDIRFHAYIMAKVKNTNEEIILRSEKTL